MMYRYYGNIATAVCEAGHMTAQTSATKCETCGASLNTLQILSDIGRLPVNIVGYKNTGRGLVAVVRDCDCEIHDYDESWFVKNHCCPAVIDFPLLASRLFAWGVITMFVEGDGND